MADGGVTGGSGTASSMCTNSGGIKNSDDAHDSEDEDSGSAEAAGFAFLLRGRGALARSALFLSRFFSGI
jgi:hypothetical protein